MEFRQLIIILTATLCFFLSIPLFADEKSDTTLKDLFHFSVGVAINDKIVSSSDSKTLKALNEFNSLTPENTFKWDHLQPSENQFRFEKADQYLRFAETHQLDFIGHTLVWHSQLPDWVSKEGDETEVSRDMLIARMKKHITSVVSRYKGRVKGWDVVNEAISDDKETFLRNSIWKNVIGENYIDIAFHTAKGIDPEAELYYNDYNLEDPVKRSKCIKLLKGMIERGVPIDGVGTQSHFLLDYPHSEEIEKTITMFSELGLKVIVSELDVDVLPRQQPGIADISETELSSKSSDPFKNGLPTSIQNTLSNRYREIFEIYVKHSQNIDRVTVWGLSDGQSWLNNFPQKGRTNHPLLFDRDMNPKPALDTLKNLR